MLNPFTELSWAGAGKCETKKIVRNTNAFGEP